MEWAVAHPGHRRHGPALELHLRRNGQLTSRTDPLGAQVTVQYSQSIPAPAPLLTLGAAGKVLDPTGTSGTTSKLANLWGGGRVGKFDGQGCASTGKNQYLREKRQFLVTYLDCRGNTTVYLYDREGNELEKTFNGKPAAKTLWDGNYQTRAIDARGLTTTTHYDYNYQPLQIIYPDGSRDQYEYEPVRGLRTKHINQGGITSTWTHDDKGRVTSWTEALGRPEQRTTRYQYDSYGQLTSRSTRGRRHRRRQQNDHLPLRQQRQPDRSHRPVGPQQQSQLQRSRSARHADRCPGQYHHAEL
ncbi:hypothetical protein GY14_32015 [Delftia tsuruhatensis]|nr:hypothetical protein GY14_32015 [Delftia tsuruhatensis]